MQKLVNGELVDLTQDEIQQFNNEKQEWEDGLKDRTIASARRIAQNLVSKTAKERGYISCTDCTTWLNSTIPDMRNDAEIFILWRDSVYLALEEAITDYQIDKREIDLETFESELPQINWNLQLS